MIWHVDSLREYEDFTFIAAAVAQDLAAQNIRYAEVFFSAPDDPKMFGNALAEEYRILVEQLGFTRPEIRALILQGIRSSWLSERRKQAVEEAFTRDPVWEGC